MHNFDPYERIIKIAVVIVAARLGRRPAPKKRGDCEYIAGH